VNWVLKVEDLDFDFDKIQVLRGVNFEINQGEFIGIIGPNGGGKTTLLRLMMGLLKPKKGQLRSSTSSIGYVPQAHQFDPQFPISTIDVVLMGILRRLTWYGSFSKEDRLKAHAALEQVGLADAANKSFALLSGGQKQRVIFARALVGDPKILFLDESFAFCDVMTKKVLQAELLRINKQNKVTICMVTHDLDQAVDLVDRVLCVQRDVTVFKSSDVCEHFAMGLYHTPLKSAECRKDKKRGS
jgi:zinc transport system ATP-binding protein